MTTDTEYYNREERAFLVTLAFAALSVVGLILIVVGATLQYGVPGFLGSSGLALFVGGVLGIIVFDR